MLCSGFRVGVESNLQRKQINMSRTITNRSEPNEKITLPQPQQRGLQVPTEAAIEAVRGRLLGPRRSLVRAAFSRLESMEKGNTMGGAVPAYVVKAFDAHGHPEVIARRQSPEVRISEITTRGRETAQIAEITCLREQDQHYIKDQNLSLYGVRRRRIRLGHCASGDGQFNSTSFLFPATGICYGRLLINH